MNVNLRQCLVIIITVLTASLINNCGDNIHRETVWLAKVNTAEILPNWATPNELRSTERLDLAPADLLTTPPPPGNFYVPAEFAPTAAVVMTWTGFTEVLAAIARYSAAAGAEIWMVGGPPSLYKVPGAKAVGRKSI